uniref:Ig-like domain-containing protein n=1 Tax=Labrus bergylta TaxID=56723 RepID=A0A3Q3E059_9LABR
MTPLMIAFFLECLFLGEMTQTSDPKPLIKVRQESGFISANVGEEVTLSCFYEGEFASKYYWYKQTLGQKPELISMSYKYETNVNFHGEFQNNSRFTLDNTNGRNHLRITDVLSDSATYYCASSFKFVLNFTEGTIVSVKDSGWNVPTLVHQSASETIPPGGSVTLNCTVHTGTCDGEHSVYWFKNSEESHQEIIYTHGDSNDQCEKNTKSDTCVYNLPMKNLNLSDAGTYYCAVASCGHILFGNGTKLDLENNVDSLALVYFLIGALTFTTILVVALAFSIYKKIKGNICQCRGNVHQPERSRRQRHIETGDCVYSGVKR